MNINELKNNKEALVKEVDTLLGGSPESDEQLNEIIDKQKEIKQLDAQIETERKREEVEALKVARAAAGQGGAKKITDKDKRDLNRYSFIKAIKQANPETKGESLDGVELEMHQEAVREASESGVQISGTGVPSIMMGFNPPEKRDMVVGTATAGGHLVATDLEGFIPALRPNLVVQQAGAQVLSGLVGNLDIPKKTGETSAAWEGETDSNAESTPVVGKLSMQPHRLGAYTEVGKQLMAQTSYGVERMVREDLSFAIQKAVDYAAIAGNSSADANQPNGILYTAGIGAIFAGAAATDGTNVNGAEPTYDDPINAETEIATDNADFGKLAYLTTPGMRGKLKRTKIDAGSGQFVWDQGAKELNGYNAFVSTQVPSGGTKGTGTNLHTLIFGNWNELIIGNWAGIDMVVDPYTLAKQAKIQLVINSWWDIAVRHAESFAAGDDFIV